MGIIFGILSALTVSFQNVLFRFLEETQTVHINWFRCGFGAIILAGLVTLFNAWVIPPWQFFGLVILISLPFELLNSQYFIKAYQNSPQSLVGPLFSLTAVLLVPLGYVFNHEVPSVFGFVGVISVVIGPFFLGNGHGANIFQSYVGVFREKGSFYILLASLFASITVTTAKFTLNYASPILTAFYVVTAMFIAISVGLIFKGNNPFMGRSLKDLKMIIGGSLLFGISNVFHYLGLSKLNSAYFISIKRLSVLFDVILGSAIHKEDNFIPRLAGALIMVAGVILIAIG